MALLWKKSRFLYEFVNVIDSKGRILSKENIGDDIEKKIIDAYGKLHQHFVIHGDVRPENVLVLPDRSVRIIDFDCSCIIAKGHDLLTKEDEQVSRMCAELRGNNGKKVSNGS